MHGKRHPALTIEKIVSGGQTGADRAALDWAIDHGVAHGGWCPKGRCAEDGTIPDRYDLQEMPSKNYLRRTEQNVLDSDGTVIFSRTDTLTGGSKRTAEFAVKHRKPWLHIHAAESAPATRLVEFVSREGIKSLNVAGPRASSDPQIATFVIRILDEAFTAS